MKRYKEEAQPKKMLKSPQAINPTAIKYRGFERSPMRPLMNLLIPYVQASVVVKRPNSALVYPSSKMRAGMANVKHFLVK
jgi:hypothetical protein